MYTPDIPSADSAAPNLSGNTYVMRLQTVKLRFLTEVRHAVCRVLVADGYPDPLLASQRSSVQLDLSRSGYVARPADRMACSPVRSLRRPLLDQSMPVRSRRRGRQVQPSFDDVK